MSDVETLDPPARRRPRFTPAAWGRRRRAWLSDLVAGALLGVALVWVSLSFAVGEWWMAQGHVSVDELSGRRPVDLPDFFALGEGWSMLATPTGVAYILWMLLRGWHPVTSALAVVAALIASLLPGAVAVAQFAGHLDFVGNAVTTAVLAVLTLALAVDAYVVRRRVGAVGRPRSTRAKLIAAAILIGVFLGAVVLVAWGMFGHAG